MANDRSNEITPADFPAYGPGNIWLDTTERRSDAITARGITFQPSHHRVPGISAHLLVPTELGSSSAGSTSRHDDTARGDPPPQVVDPA